MTIELSEEQLKAVDSVLKWYRGGKKTPQIFRLYGVAGSGKSTVVSHIVEALNVRSIIAAYTGKAANVLRQKGNYNACTVHSGMYIPVESDNCQLEFRITMEAPFRNVDLIIIDEASMIPEELALDAESFGKKILVMGDPEQLPPVGAPGYWTTQTPEVFFREVHRQALDSPILRLATLARQGKPLPLGEWKDSKGNLTRVLKYSKDTLSETFRENTQPICGMHKTRWAITQYIRNLRGYEGQAPLKGESVLFCKNFSKLGIFNGSFGLMANDSQVLKTGDLLLDVKVEDIPGVMKKLRSDPYLFNQHFKNDIKRPFVSKTVHEIDWGYVLTCHKAQGSEFSDVTVIDDSKVFRDDCHRWTYTAITRASDQLTFLQR